MVHFAYPNVRSSKFIGCGRYTSCAEKPGDSYEDAEPDSQNIGEIREAELILAPGQSCSKHVYETKDQLDKLYIGNSLDLAYLLSRISCSRKIRPYMTNSDIWCTGSLGLKDERPILKPVTHGDFDIKLKAFLLEDNTDTLFIVPEANLLPVPDICADKEQNVRILSLKDFSPRNMSGKTILKVRRNELESLADAIFEPEKRKQWLKNAAWAIIVFAVIFIPCLALVPKAIEAIIRTHDAIAESEAEKFYKSALTCFEKNSPPVICDKDNLPPGYSENADIEYSGKLILGSNGTIIGKMTFSHKLSDAILTLHKNGSVTSGHNGNVKTPQGQVETGSLLNPENGTWTEPETSMIFEWMPGGCYEMGCDSYTDVGCSPCETPLHVVCLEGFWMGKYEVTTAQWKIIMGDSVMYGLNGKYSKGEEYPAVMVNWHDAKAFTGKLNKKRGGKFRLPTEAEWEYACKDSEKPLPEGVSDKLQPISIREPDGPGIHDMNGNVWEWCEDTYSEQAYHSHRLSNPVINDGSSRVVRGGSWRYGERFSRCSFRSGRPPERRNLDTGFRIVKTP